LKGFLRTSARKYDQASFIYKPYHKNVELHIFTDDTQAQGQNWEIKPLGPFHPNRTGDLHVIMTRGKTIGWNFTEEDIQSATKGIDLFGGRWDDVDWWTLKSFSSRGIERRVNLIYRRSTALTRRKPSVPVGDGKARRRLAQFRGSACTGRLELTEWR